MKLLFTGPLLDFSGFAHASRIFLRTLLQDPNIDVVARALQYDRLDAGQKFVPEPWLAGVLQKDLQGVNMCIQMTTCNVEAVPIPGILNGLYTFLESSHMQVSWSQKANEFDFIMVPSKANAEAMLNSGVIKPIVVCGLPCDLDVYQKQYEPYKIEHASDRTVFYNICQLSHKKGIDALLRAYHVAFWDKPDEVLLVLKTYIDMNNRQNDLENVKAYIKNIRDRCRIPVDRFPPVLPLVFTMTDDEIHGLHTRGDAYICSSRAEGWGLPVFDALAHGKTVITNNAGGLADFVTQENSLVYNGMPTYFFDSPHSDPGLYTGLEQCFEPCLPSMAMVMRHYHSLLKKQLDDKAQWDSVLARRDNAKLVGMNFDYRRICHVINKNVHDIFNVWQEKGKVSFDNANPT
jgi:glycosyltransferase involved in cell wall biosynthesis